MSKPARAKYRTTNWTEYNAALKHRGSLMVWLDADLQWKASPSGRNGRPAVFRDAAIQFCLNLKCMFGLGLRQATGLAESLLGLAKLDWPVPDYSTVCRRQKTLSVAITARVNSAGLHLLIDSTGVKMLGEGEWKTKKHGADYRRQWRKVHLGIDAQTLEIRAIEITDNAIGEAPMLTEPLAQIPAGERVHSVSADGAYDTKACHEAIAGRQASAIIPTRRKAKPWLDARAGAQARNEILRATRKLERAIWNKWSGYHRRSLVETKMGCFKRLGERVMARDFDRQVTELQVRASILTGSPAWVRPERCGWDNSVWGKGDLDLKSGYATAPISGAIQHLESVKGSKVIVAVTRAATRRSTGWLSTGWRRICLRPLPRGAKSLSTHATERTSGSLIPVALCLLKISTPKPMETETA